MKRLLIDVSFIYETNVNTGIQRVVRHVIENIGFIKEKFGIKISFILLHKDENIYEFLFEEKLEKESYDTY